MDQCNPTSGSRRGGPAKEDASPANRAAMLASERLDRVIRRLIEGGDRARRARGPAEPGSKPGRERGGGSGIRRREARSLRHQE